MFSSAVKSLGQKKERLEKEQETIIKLYNSMAHHVLFLLNKIYISIIGKLHIAIL